jgi:hypothetical protein
MIKRKLLFLFLFIYSFVPAYSQCLSGVYTIGRSSSDYLNFTSAIQALVTNGVCGQVTFLVSDSAIYSEQILIPLIPGATLANRIKFISDPANLSTPILGFNGTSINPYLIMLDGAKYISFENLWLNYHGVTVFAPSISSAVVLQNGASNLSITNCILYSDDNCIATAWAFQTLAYDSNHVENCDILFGLMDWHGLGISQGNEFRNNHFYETMQLKLNAMGSFVVSDNIFECVTGVVQQQSPIALDILLCDSGGVVQRNNFIGKWTRAIEVNSCTAPYNSIILMNNLIDGGGVGVSHQIEGIYIFSSDNIKVYNNNISITDLYLPIYDACIRVMNTDRLEIFNNVISNTGGGLALYLSNITSNFSSDYNAFFMSGNRLVQYSNTQYWSNLSSWQNFNVNLDQHSIFCNPGFYSSSDLHVAAIQLRNAALPLTEVIDDFDKEIRNTAPDIGADEFSNLVDSVWPGDANNDGAVDFTDIIPIGLYFGNIGPVRTLQGNLWIPYASNAWNINGTSFPDAKFSDSNGDGIVNLNDTLAINLNSNSVHNLRIHNASLGSIGPNLLLISDSIEAYPGDITTWRVRPTSDLFTLSPYSYILGVETSNSDLEVSLANIEVDSSWGTYANNMLSCEDHSTAANGKLLTVTGIDHQPRSSANEWLKLNVRIATNASVGEWLKISPVLLKVYDVFGAPILANMNSDSIYVKSVVGLPESVQTNEVNYVQNANEIKFNGVYSEIGLYDIAGRLITSKVDVSDTFLISSPPGVYILKVIFNSHPHSFKIIVE